jgi:hypothetical protein
MRPGCARIEHAAVVWARFAAIVLLSSLPLSACNCEDEIGALSGAIEVDPPALDFGTVALGLAKELPLTIHNRGLYVLNIERFSAAAPFIAPAGTATIGTGSSITVDAGYVASMLGAEAGTLVIQSDDPKTPMVSVPLAGTGIEAAVRVEPPMIDFGEVDWVAGSTPRVVMVTVSNPGTDAFDLTSLELAAGTGAAFMLDRAAAVGEYAPGASKTFAVSYLPNARAEASGSVVIRTTTRMAPEITVPLRGKGVGPEMQICSSATGGVETCTANGEIPRVQFGNIDRNGTATGTIRVTNAGDRDLILGSVFLTSDAPEFSFTPAVPSAGTQTIAPGAESSWTVTYAPQDYAFDAVLVGFASNDPRGSRSVDVRGGVKSARIRVSPGSLTFTHSGGVNRGETPVRIYNCGEEPLVIARNVVLTQTAGPGPALSITGAPAAGTTIMPQPMCEMEAPGAQLTVVFETMTDGNYTAQIEIESNDPTNALVTVNIVATKR